MTDVEAQEHYDRFFEDVFLEMEEKVSFLLLDQFAIFELI